jgi:hypothetical protein
MLGSETKLPFQQAHKNFPNDPTEVKTIHRPRHRDPFSLSLEL